MTAEEFLQRLQAQAATFAKAVAPDEGEWIIKGFIDVYRRIYTISVDTQIVSKVLELLLFPMFVEFAKTHALKIELCPQQNFYPDITLTHESSGRKFAVDIKSTYRTSEAEVNVLFDERHGPGAGPRAPIHESEDLSRIQEARRGHAPRS
jgi:hypothetical protein